MDLVSRYPSIFFIMLYPTINTVSFDFLFFDQLLLSHHFASLKFDFCHFLLKFQLQRSDLFYQTYYKSFQQFSLVLFLAGVEFSLSSLFFYFLPYFLFVKFIFLIFYASDFQISGFCEDLDCISRILFYRFGKLSIN